MANAGWGHGGPAESETGILQALMAFVAQGGQLFGARRWSENPLTLTHVRWQGPSGMTVEAFRDPLGDAALGGEERDVWIQLALTFPPVPPTQAGAEPPWMPLLVDVEQAARWAQGLRQARPRDRSQARVPSAPPPLSAPRLPTVPLTADGGWGSETTRLPRLDALRAHALQMDSQAPRPPAVSQVRTPPPEPPARPPLPAPYETYDASYDASYEAPPRSEPSQWTGGWQQGAVDAPEVQVLVCIEVELPTLLDGQVGAAYRADFARDIAIHFARAVWQIPQVREHHAERIFQQAL
jgi:hypothetical protein